MNHYPPPHHQEADFENCLRLVEAMPLATIVSAQKDHILTTHTPLVYHPDEGLGYFIGHLDLYNPQVAHLDAGVSVTVIFHGPETYISPTDYQSTQLPTWNYFKAHFCGSVQTYRTPKTNPREPHSNDRHVRRPKRNLCFGRKQSSNGKSLTLYHWV